jgi:hypothetical protein
MTCDHKSSHKRDDDDSYYWQDPKDATRESSHQVGH